MTNAHPNFVRNCWYVAGWDYEFTAGTPHSRTLLGEPVVFFRKGCGTLVAMADRCVHRLAPLSLGRIEGDDIRCMYHGMRFTAEGQCVEIPGQDVIPKSACIRTYPVAEQGSWAWIWMGDPNLADPALLPHARGLDDPEWVLKTGQLDYAAPHELINDNLLDLSHLAYVHLASFGATTGWITRQPRTTQIARGVRVDRWVEGAPPLPPLPSLAAHESVDMWASYEFLIPGVFLMHTSLHPPGTAAACNHEAPAGDVLFSNFTCQAVTPLTADSSRYFFSWGPGAAFGDEIIAQQMIDVAMAAFLEDKQIIEAQARIIAMSPGEMIMPNAADRTVTIFQRMMERMKQPASALAQP
jgi:vanillate O-demethylase monooxygenase subunit